MDMVTSISDWLAAPGKPGSGGGGVGGWAWLLPQFIAAMAGSHAHWVCASTENRSGGVILWAVVASRTMDAPRRHVSITASVTPSMSDVTPTMAPSAVKEDGATRASIRAQQQPPRPDSPITPTGRGPPTRH
eukprot:COSAG04_NODE_3431_length_2819_cov_2.837132_1_plen_132_part_00